MRIGLDITPALRQQAGVGRYTRQLARALLALGTEHDWVWVQTRDTPPLADMALSGDGWQRVVPCRLPLTERVLDIIWQRLHLPLPIERWSGPLDVYHATNFALPPLRRARGVVTIHDLAFLRMPEYADPALRRFLSHTVRRSVQQAAHILADSEATRRDVIELLDVVPEKVTVALSGVEPVYRPDIAEAERQQVLAKHRLPTPYILSVATVEPRKNHRGLIAAFAQMRRRSGLRHHLAIAGGKGWLSEDIYRAPAQHGIQDAVHFLGRVADRDLPALYAAADLFVFPSFYEGFGLPPLEAMACGVPVITSDVSSLPEIVGDAGLLLDPYNTDGLSAAMEQVLTDTALRNTLREKGPRRAAQFTWQRTAEAAMQAYHLAAGH